MCSAKKETLHRKIRAADFAWALAAKTRALP